MSDQTDTFSTLLASYGLTQEESLIYIDLLKNSFSTALAISRRLHIGRTKVYRIVDTLKKKRLVEEKLGDRGLEFGAANPHRLEQLASEKEVQAKVLLQNSHLLATQLEKLVAPFQRSKVLYYEGQDGLEQVSYNTTHTKGIMRVYEFAHMSDFINKNLAEKIREKYVERNITTYDLTNQESFPGFTDVHKHIESLSQFRYIDSSVLEIKFETLIYNDVYATYTYSNDEIFCVEVYNEQLATMQKQIFDYIWKQAESMKFIDKRGAAKRSSMV